MVLDLSAASESNARPKWMPAHFVIRHIGPDCDKVLSHGTIRLFALLVLRLYQVLMVFRYLISSADVVLPRLSQCDLVSQSGVQTCACISPKTDSGLKTVCVLTAE